MNVYQITVVPKSSGKDESHNKLHFCTFCKDTKFTNFAKHLIEMHSEEEEVQFINLHLKKTKKRNEMISLLKERGNHDMNMKTIKAEEGMFVPNRRVSPGTRWQVSDYSPCPNCHVWVLQKILWKHHPKCPALQTNKDNTTPQGC